MEKTKNDVSIGTPYDDAFRTMLTEGKSLIIPFVNEVFGTDYDRDEKVIMWQNEFFIVGSNQKRITDAHFQIGADSLEKYHFECESSKEDGSVLIRIFKYGSFIAAQHGGLNEGRFTVRFPHSSILYLRGNLQKQEPFHIVVQTPGGEISYPVPVVRMSRYDLGDIFEKSLYFLLPFYLFNRESDFGRICNDKQEQSKFFQLYRDILCTLNRLQNEGELNSYMVRLIRSMTVKVAEGLAMKYEVIRKGVGEIMGGQVLDFEAKRIHDDGIEQGREQGIEQGRVDRDREKICEMLDAGRDPKAIADFCNYPMSLIEQVQKSRLAASSH